MLDRTSQFNSLGNLPDKIIIDGEARLSFKCEGSKYTKLDKLYQSDPQRVLFPNASTGAVSYTHLTLPTTPYV